MTMMSLGRSFITGLVLAAAVAGHPAARRGNIQPRDDMNADVTVIDADVVTPTVETGTVSWVDEAGNPTSTAVARILAVPLQTVSTQRRPTTDPTSPPGHAVPPKLRQPIIINESQNAPSDNAGLPAPEAAAGASASGSVFPPPPHSGSGLTVDPSRPMPGPASNGTGSKSDLFGISYAPYRANHDCKSPAEIKDDLSRLAGQYSSLRIYGTDCDQVKNIHNAAQGTGLKLFLGIWDINQVEKEVDMMVDGVSGDWGQVKAISVGNELVNSGQASPSQVVAAVRQARQCLRSRGYQGPVVTVDTFVATESHPELCEESDFCAINAHSFFDSAVDAKNAGSWLANTVERVRSRLSTPDKKIMVTETGWPTQGESNGRAVPNMSNQRDALASIRDAFRSSPQDVIIFSAFNDGWKPKEMGTFMAEPYWGVDGAISLSDR